MLWRRRAWPATILPLKMAVSYHQCGEKPAEQPANGATLAAAAPAGLRHSVWQQPRNVLAMGIV